MIGDFGDDGILLDDASNTTVAGNYLGVDVSGSGSFDNTNAGVEISGGSGNTIGATTTSGRDLISGNTGDGVEITGSATGNLIEGNVIGTDSSGTAALANHNGVVIDTGDSSNTIGGTTSGAANLISGNSADAVEIGGTGNLVAGNLIGTTADGSAALANGYGVVLISQGNTIGGTAAARAT